MFVVLLATGVSKSILAAPGGYIGEITIFVGNYAPQGSYFCDGRELLISKHQELWSILWTKYGGDGRTTFKLPDLREAEKSLNGARYIITTDGVIPPRW